MSEDFTITSEEVERLKEALKKDEFRKLLHEYAEEISDPKNRKRYEKEICELEKYRGFDAKFINPEPGFALKAREVSTNKKVFLNICQSENVQPASATDSIYGKTKGQQWSIPYSLTPPRDDLDKAKKTCRVFDVVFHSKTYQRGQENSRFQELLISTALDGIQRQFSVIVDRKSVKRLKMKFKGVPTPSIIRTKKDEPVPKESHAEDLLKFPYPPLNCLGQDALGNQPSEKAKTKNLVQKKKPAKKPRYSVVHRGHFDMRDTLESRERHLVRRPKELVVTVDLPKMESASDMDLNVFKKRIFLQSQDYHLDLVLPYPVDEENCSAQFDKHNHSLSIVLPVLPLLISSDAPITTCGSSTESVPDVKEEEALQRASLDNEELPDSVPLEISCENSVPNDSNTSQASGDTTANDILSCDFLSSQVRSDWSVCDAWICPPFSYEQSEDHVTIVLHVPHVKKASMTSLLENNLCLLTFRGGRAMGNDIGAPGQSYSFRVEFSDGCCMNPDGSKVDVSEDNVVLVLDKETKGLWERFMAGMSSSQMQEKLFLTEKNVMSAISHPFDGSWSSSLEEEVSPSSGSEARVEVVSANKNSAEIQLTFQESQGLDNCCSEEAVDDCDGLQVENLSLSNELKDTVTEAEVTERSRNKKQVHWNLPPANLTSDQGNLKVESHTKQEKPFFSQSEDDQDLTSGAAKDAVCSQSSDGQGTRNTNLKLSNALLFALD